MGDTQERYYRVKNECIQLLGGRCAFCGSQEDLEFDHIDPATKEFSIIGGSRVARARLLEELKKCQLLCKDCHKKKTYGDRSPRHGSKITWNRGCHCADCREGQRIRMAEYRKKKRAYGATADAPRSNRGDEGSSPSRLTTGSSAAR